MDRASRSGENTIPVIFDLTVDACGRVLVGGCQFEGCEDVGPRLMRLDAAGRLDREFDLPPGVDQPVRSVLVQSDGKIVVNGLYRFLPDGGVDPGFSPPPFQFVSLTAVALQADGKILLGAHLGLTDYSYEDELIRLNPDGSLDSSFGVGLTLQESPDFLDGTAAAALAVQPDGRILVAGNFGLVNGIHRHFVARFFPDGALDNSFDPQFESCHPCDYG